MIELSKSIELHSHGDKDLQLAACSILAPQLIECLNDENANLEERILASFSLCSLTKDRGMQYLLDLNILSQESLFWKVTNVLFTFQLGP
ncbi:hypothetical protein CDL12_09315 [Handroanthus impetiginosus]|uniref:Putative E3 ubiquitin-protein ligase LIN ARM-like domain-containing protein n=1 Tax=Handroanthus impetiginosus TaxID=429701 RepID=A0A2G9HKG6_9LAMI|nr:hypothetical protein CDL12_09315 [Handroanthus impetiginosus]